VVTVPAGSPASVDLRVRTRAGTDTLTAAYTYLPPPTIASLTPVKGKTAGGETISITGTNFLPDGTSVLVGGAPATSVQVLSSTSLTAVTPPGSAGPADVVITTSGGTATKSAAFTYFASPVITGFAPAQGGAGTVVSISGQNFDSDAFGDRV